MATIARLMKPIKGGFVATVNSDKLANGKVRGSVVVRVPPENLDELILELRTNLGKSGELKNQRISSLDIGKEYTDLESRLKAAQAMEERLLQIIKNGKGEIKDLLAAEKQLGEWRERIEKIEGELRCYANQVALSTLKITLYEKEIEAAYGVIEREQVQMGIESDDVDKTFQAARKAVREAKGRITRSELKQPTPGQFRRSTRFRGTRRTRRDRCAITSSNSARWLVWRSRGKRKRRVAAANPTTAKANAATHIFTFTSTTLPTCRRDKP